LTSGFAPALRDRKAHHRGHAIPCAAQGLERFGHPKSERANHTRCRNCHAGWIICGFSPVSLSHFLTPKIDLDFYCFLKRSTLKVTARTGNGSPEVGGLSVEFIQWRFEIR
jgi:hypothetical protein